MESAAGSTLGFFVVRGFVVFVGGLAAAARADLRRARLPGTNSAIDTGEGARRFRLLETSSPSTMDRTSFSESSMSSVFEDRDGLVMAIGFLAILPERRDLISRPGNLTCTTYVVVQWAILQFLGRTFQRLPACA